MGIRQDSVDAAWKRAKKTSGKRIILRDDNPRGLIAIVGARGGTYYFEFKRPGSKTTERQLIGPAATVTLQQARDQATAIKATIKVDADKVRPTPAAKREAAKVAEKTSRECLAEFAKLLKEAGKSQATIDATKIHVKAALQLDGIEKFDLSPAEVTQDDLYAIIEAAPAGSKKARYGYLSRFLRWCGQKKYRERFREIELERGEKPPAPKPRTRWLTESELTHLIKALEKAERATRTENGFRSKGRADFVRFLIAVPCRRNEAAELTYDQLDLEKRMWTQPDLITKNDQPHRVPISDVALQIIKRQGKPSQKGLVFRSAGGGPIDNFARLKRVIDRFMPPDIPEWNIHDLRRTFASHMAELRVPEDLCDQMLNHRASASRGGVKGVYQMALRWDERVEAMQKWGQLLERLGLK